MRLLAATLFASVACSPRAKRPADKAVAVEAGPQAPPVAPPRSLREELEASPVEGIALVDSSAVLYATASDARNATPPDLATSESPRVRPSTVVIVKDEGDVVLVRTRLDKDSVLDREVFNTGDGFSYRSVLDNGDTYELGNGGVHDLTPKFELTLYARKDQLIPVLRKPWLRSFDDGTAIVLHAGVPLFIDGSIRPQTRAFAGVPQLTIPEGHVALSLPLVPEKATLPAGAALQCQDGGPTKLVKADPTNPDSPTGAPCHLRYKGDDLSLYIGGAPVFEAKQFTHSCPHTRPVPVFAGSSAAKPLVLLELPRATLLSATSPTALSVPCDQREHVDPLSARGNMWGDAIGVGRWRGRPRTKKVPGIIGRVPLFFPDGRPAGHHVGDSLVLENTSTSSNRTCIAHENVATKLCFDNKHVTEVEVEDLGKGSGLGTIAPSPSGPEEQRGSSRGR